MKPAKNLLQNGNCLASCGGLLRLCQLLAATVQLFLQLGRGLHRRLFDALHCQRHCVGVVPLPLGSRLHVLALGRNHSLSQRPVVLGAQVCEFLAKGTGSWKDGDSPIPSPDCLARRGQLQQLLPPCVLDSVEL